MLFCGDRDDHNAVAVPFIRDQAMIGQLFLDQIRVRVGAVHLIHRDDDRYPGGFCVGDRFFCLRHDAVIGGNDQDHDIGTLGAAGTHRTEGRVAGCVKERDRPAFVFDLIRTDVLCDPAGFTGSHVGIADRVQE